MGTWKNIDRNLYIDDEMVGVLVGLPDEAAKLASAIVIAMNAQPDPEERYPVGTRVRDCEGDVWIMGAKGWGMENGTGLSGTYPAKMLEEHYGPLEVLDRPWG